MLVGRTAAQHIQRNGLRPADIGCVPAAAGGPKGLAWGEMSYLRREDVVFAGKNSNQTDKNENENQRI